MPVKQRLDADSDAMVKEGKPSLEHADLVALLFDPSLTAACAHNTETLLNFAPIRGIGSCLGATRPLLPPATIDLMMTKATIRRYRKGDVVLEQGVANESLFVILEGCLESSVVLGHARALLGRKQTGEYFGETGLLSGSPSPTTMVTVEDTRIGIVSRSSFAECSTAQQDLLSTLVSGLGYTIAEFAERLGTVSLDAYGRLRFMLYRLAEERDGTFVVGGQWTQQHLADLTGCTRVTVCKLIGVLRRGQWLTTDRNGIVLLRPLPEKF
jgi:CRP/FNR family cyclic AMP-dependent transcriptional regulator